MAIEVVFRVVLKESTLGRDVNFKEANGVEGLLSIISLIISPKKDVF